MNTVNGVGCKWKQNGLCDRLRFLIGHVCSKFWRESETT